MNIQVLLKLAPDTVEELVISADGRSLDTEALRCKSSDPDDHAIEQAVLLKEKFGGSVTVLGLDGPDLDDVLFNAAAKGADRLVKLTGDVAALPSRQAAQAMAHYLRPDGQALPPDTLILLRSQASDDLDGELGAYLAARLGIPYACVVTRVAPEAGQVRIVREFAGGLRGEFVVPLPAILGIQSAEKPPRYVPIAKVRAAMKTARIESVSWTAEDSPGLAIERLYAPVVAGHANMLEGNPEEMAEQMVNVLVQCNAV